MNDELMTVFIEVIADSLDVLKVDCSLDLRFLNVVDFRVCDEEISVLYFAIVVNLLQASWEQYLFFWFELRSYLGVSVDFQVI